MALDVTMLTVGPIAENCFLVRRDGAESMLVVDPGEEPDRILAAIEASGARVEAILLTHCHFDHIGAVAPVAAATGAPVLLHQGDEMLWRMIYPGTRPDEDLGDEQVIEIAATPLRVLHTPGHSPGSVCLYAPALGTVFSGDTLFHGGPGATGRSYSDYDTIIASIRGRLLGLPPETVVRTGHGQDTTIGAEAAQFKA